jgi:uncharacterized protein
MKRYRISLYTIFINLEDAEGRYLLIHGYTGAIDQASAKVISFLRSGKPITESEELPFSKETLQRLINRGYVTDKSPFEEKDSVKSMAEAFHKRDKMRKNFLFLVAYDCNFRCPYCFENAISGNGKGWSKKVFTKNAADKAYEAMLELESNRKLHANQITLYGGEPLLALNKEVVNYIVDKGVSLGYTFMAITNGYDLEHFENLLRPGVIEKLQISIDGDREKHDNRRTHFQTGRSYDKIMANMSLALKQGVSISVRINTELNNFEDIKKIRAEFESLDFFTYKNFSVYSALIHGEDDMNCNAVMIKKVEPEASLTSLGFNDTDFLNEFDPDQQYINFENEQVRFDSPESTTVSFHDEKPNIQDKIHTINRGKYIQKHFEAVAIDPKMEAISCQDFGIRSKIKRALDSKGLIDFRSTFCTAQTGMMIFDPYGDLYSCWETVGMDKHKVGSYRDGVQLDNEELEHWYGRNISKTPACSRCKYAFFCGGGCQAHALREGRGYNSPYCDGYPKTFQKVVSELYKSHITSEKI